MQRNKKGFTLLEILLVIAAIGILAAIVLIAINPNRQLAQARNTVRQSDINTLQKAIDQQALDNTPAGTYISAITALSSPLEICGPAGGCGGGYIDLSSLVPTYLAAIPRDPQAVSPGSGYKVVVNPNNNKISVIASLAENRIIANNLALWTPSAFGSSLSFWADANDEASLTLNNQVNAQTISQWNDKSVNGRHLTQTIVTQQPELVRGMGNMLRYTQESDNAYWTKLSASITPNTITAPDGTLTADKLVENNAPSVQHQLSRSMSTLPDNITYTVSAYLKAGERNWARIGLYRKDNVTAGIWVNLTDGSLGTNIGAVTPTVTNIGNGWWRVTVTTNSATGANTPRFYIFTADSGSNITYTGDGVSGIFVWGAMMNEGATANEYIGRNSLAADGLDDFMNTGSFVLAQPLSRFTLVTRRNAAAFSRVLIDRNSASALSPSTTTDMRTWAPAAIFSAQTFSTGQTSQFGELHNGSSSTLFNNALATTGDVGINGMDGLVVGAALGGGNAGQYDFHTALILNRLPTLIERQKLEGYLAWRYGIQSTLPINHPFRTIQPNLD